MNNGSLRHKQLLGHFYFRSSLCKVLVTVGVFVRRKLTPSTLALKLHTANVRVGPSCDWRINVSEFWTLVVLLLGNRVQATHVEIRMIGLRSGWDVKG